MANMHRKKTISLAAALFLLIGICIDYSFGETSGGTEWDLVSFARTAGEVSDQRATAERAVDAAREHFEEVRLAGATEIDVDEAEAAVTTATLALAETTNSVVYQAVSMFLTYLRTARSLEFSRRQLDIKKHVEEVSKQRFAEGVKTEEAYLADVAARLNADLAVMKSENALESSRRMLLRFVDSDVEGTSGFTEVKLPYIAADVEREEFLADICKTSSTFFRLKKAAEIAQRRFSALSRLTSSVAGKELANAALAAATTAYAFEGEEAAAADQAWQLVATLSLHEKTVEIGGQLLSVAEKSLEKRREQFKFGLISDIQLAAYELAFDQSKDQAARKVEDHYLHYLRIQQAQGMDLLAVLKETIQ